MSISTNHKITEQEEVENSNFIILPHLISGNYAGISQWQTVRFPNLEVRVRIPLSAFNDRLLKIKVNGVD